MNQKFAVLPRLLSSTQPVVSYIAVAIGFLTLALLAQLRFSIPWSPVPITGQTFGVTLIALTYGRKLGTITVFSYLLAGFCGLPVLAGSVAAFTIIPTSGYLLGMLISSFIISWLADLGYAQKFSSAIACGFLGSIIVYCTGAFVLAHFIPLSRVFVLGVLPFIPGDIIKTFSAAAIATGTQRMLNHR